MEIFVIAEDGGDGAVMGFYAHGHHEPEAFAAAVLAEHEAVIQPATVRHAWLRMIPDRRGGMRILEYAQGDGRGSFAATVADWGD